MSVPASIAPLADTHTAAIPLDNSFESRFQLLRELGRGAMGSVHVAFDRELCRELAVKQILPAGIDQPEYQERFRREYRALAAISDPGVPKVYHSGRTPDGGAWFTMEIVRGEPLRTILNRGALPPLRALDVAIELARILAVAHAAGVIHRDVKPSNIMLEPGDRVRLLDFGVCAPMKRFLRAAEPYRRTADVDRWETGEANFAGTIGYSDPNTHDGSPATVRSDIFSVAAILYEMLAGRRLCDPDTGIFRTIDSAELPPELGELAVDLRHATAHNPYRRPQTMTDLVQRLEIARGNFVRLQATTPRPRPHTPTLVLAALTLTLAAVATTLALSDRHTSASLTAAHDPDATRPRDPRPATPDAPTAREPRPDATPDAPTAGEPRPATTPELPAPAVSAPTPDSPTIDPAAPPSLARQPDAPRNDVPASARTATTPLARLRHRLDRRTPQIAACVARAGRPGAALTVILDRGPDETATARLDPDQRSPLARCVAAALTDLPLPRTITTPLPHTFTLAR